MRLRLLIFISFLFLNLYLVNAQVGIDTDDPDPSAVLHVESADKGVLLPRVALSGPSDVSTVISPATGLVVFNTDAVIGLDSGFCYFDGSVWVNIKDDNSTITDWKLNGNNLSGGEFLGSTNSNPLTFKVNGSNVAQFNTNNSITMGVDAAVSNDDSMAMGVESSATGTESVAIGKGADATATGSVAIGRDAVSSEVDAIVLGNSSSRVGIGTSSPDASTKLHVVGSVKIEDGTEGLDKVLVSDADGGGSWQTVFSDINSEMYSDTSQSITTATTSRINFTDSDIASNMTVDLPTDNITIPSDGVYEISFSASFFQTTNSDRQIELFAVTNNATIIGKSRSFAGHSEDDVSFNISKSFVANLTSGTTISIWYTSSGGSLSVQPGAYTSIRKLSN